MKYGYERPTPDGGYEISHKRKMAKYYVRWDKDGKLIKDSFTFIKAGSAEPKRQDTGCRSCGEKSRKQLSNVIQYIAGSIGIIKADLGIDAIDQEVMLKRKSICLDCKHYDFGSCMECGCWLVKKVAIKSESCPIGKW